MKSSSVSSLVICNWQSVLYQAGHGKYEDTWREVDEDAMHGHLEIMHTMHMMHFLRGCSP
jgi:hypothetical protein